MSDLNLWFTKGDLRKDIINNLQPECASGERNNRYVIFEYVKELDITLVYIKVNWRTKDEDRIREILKKDWFKNNFEKLRLFNYDITKKERRGSEIDPINSRVFYCAYKPFTQEVCDRIKELKDYVLYNYLPENLPNQDKEGLPQIFLLKFDMKKEDMESIISYETVDKSIELFKDIHVPNDYLKLGTGNCNRKKYSVSVKENIGGIQWHSPTDFNDLEEIKNLFREKNWSAVISGSYSFFDNFETDKNSVRKIDELTLPYLLIADTIVKY